MAKAEIEIKVADLPEVKRLIEAAAERIKAIEAAAVPLFRALDALDAANAKAIAEHGAPPPWPVRPGTPRAVIDEVRRLRAVLDPTPGEPE